MFEHKPAGGPGVAHQSAQAVAEQCRHRAIAFTRTVGALVRDGFESGFDSYPKRGGEDVVTSLDLRAEEQIVRTIHAEFPAHRVLSEESGEHFSQLGPWTWLVDPLDGSNNLVIGMPAVAIGLALVHGREPLLGVVHEPLIGRTWSAVKGVGAWNGDEPLRRKKRTLAAKPIVAWTQGYGVGTADPAACALRSALQRNSHRLLELWAPLVAWAMLARGEIDAIVGYRIGEFDLHAGAVIATASGIEVRDLDGGLFDTRLGDLSESRNVVAAAPERLDEILGLVRPLI